MYCQLCGKLIYTIGGLCKECSPELHRKWEERREAVNALCDEYEAETGISALANWTAFEDWCTEKEAMG